MNATETNPAFSVVRPPENPYNRMTGSRSRLKGRNAPATITGTMFGDSSTRLLAALSDAEKQEGLWQGMLWFGGVLAVILIGLLVAVKVTKRLRQDAASDDGVLFDLEELRKMHERGDLTKPEYEALRMRAIEALRASMPGRPGVESSRKQQ